MSATYTGGGRFIRPSEVIVRLKETRTTLSLTTADFQLFGAAEFQTAMESGDFVKNTKKAALYIMTGNSSATTITENGLGISDVSHAIDIVLYLRMRDQRGQRSDQWSVWFKEYLIRSLQGFQAYDGSQPLMFGGDQFNATQNVAGYSRTFQLTQTVRIEGEDLIGDGDFDDLDEFTELFMTMTIDDSWFLRTFNATTATTGDLYTLLATMIYDYKNEFETYDITVTPLFTFNPNTATMGQMFDAAGTIASELGGTISAYTITEPTGGWKRTFDPKTDSIGDLADVLATFIEDVSTGAGTEASYNTFPIGFGLDLLLR
jgi:hypothetical protein